MKPTAIKKCQKHLLDLRERLVGDVSELQRKAMRGAGGESSGSLSNVPLHLADLGTDAFEKEVDFDLVGNEEHILDEINAALERVERGTFGRCEQCDREITAERLLTIPYSRYCVSCAQKKEKKA